MKECDVVVVGGGAAGLSAALVLVRARRTVVVVDAGAPRNAPAAHLRGFLSRDGMPPRELLAAGRAEVSSYGGGLINDTVVGVVNCLHRTHQGACYEFVWVNGVEVRMTFPQAGNPLPTIPNARVQNFYVIAAQTDTPQADVPPIHDHTIQAAPGDPGWTPFMHGYFVICSAEGLTSGCAAVSTDFGFGPLPLAQSVNGEPLTSAETIEAGIDAGLLDVVDTGAVFIGTVSPAR
jgi:hypothetical protein